MKVDRSFSPTKQIMMVEAAGMVAKAWKKLASQFPGAFSIPGMLFLFLLLQPESSVAYYVGPEVGKAPSETRLVETRTILGIRNATSLAEAAYVPYVYSVGNNVVTFLRSIVPALQPKVDFFAEQIQDSIDIANTKLMQTLENSNNGIIAVENFFTGLMKAFVFGKGPEEEERRRRFAMTLIRSGMLNVTTLGTTTTSGTTTTTTSTTTNSPIEKSPGNSVTQRMVRGATTSIIPTTTTGNPATTTSSPSPTTTTETTTSSPSSSSSTMKTTTETKLPSMEEISSNDLDLMLNPPMKGDKTRDNLFNKMRVISIVKNRS